MEVLRLFPIEPTNVARSTANRGAVSAREPDDADWHEAERFLADHLERDGELAEIQVALALCDAAGSRERATLEELILDRYRFPRSAQAIGRVIELLELPPAERPQGFWPRFLLDQLAAPGQS